MARREREMQRAQLAAVADRPRERKMQFAPLPRPRALVLAAAASSGMRRPAADPRRRSAARHRRASSIVPGSPIAASSATRGSPLSATARSNLRSGASTAVRRESRACPRPNPGTGMSSPIPGIPRSASVAPDLEREQRVPERRLHDPAQQMPRQTEAEPLRRAASASRQGSSGPTPHPLQTPRSSARSSSRHAAETPGEQETRPARRRAGARRTPTRRRKASRATGRRRSPPAAGPPPASARRAPSKPSAIASGPAAVRRSAARAQQRHLQSGRRCGAGTGSAPTSTPSNRSISAANDSRASAPLGRAVSTRHPRSRPIAIPVSHSVVLPIPGPPTRTSPPTPRSAPRNSRNTPHSCSRPTIRATLSSVPSGTFPLSQATDRCVEFVNEVIRRERTARRAAPGCRSSRPAGGRR